MTRSPRSTAARATGKPTVSDIARRAGVSIASVSRVFNNTGRVGDATRARILAIAAELDYSPNPAARSLASRRSRVVGAVIPSLENLNFAIAVDALQRRLHDANYTLLLSTSDYRSDKELAQIRALAARRVAAMVLIGTRHQPEVRELLDARGIPLLETWTRDDAGTSIGFDNLAVARAAADYLLDLGHVEIGVIAGHTTNNDRAAARIAGVRAALAGRGLTLAHERLVERSYRIAEGRRGLRELLHAGAGVTAVLCMSDTLAWGAMLEARALGLVVPDDLSVVGFDDVDFAAELEPGLTTVRVPAAQIGDAAARYLVELLDAGASSMPSPFAAELVIRGSTAPPPGRGARRGSRSGR